MTARAALARAADAGIHCMPIPAPFRVGRVNAGGHVVERRDGDLFRFAVA